MWMWLWIGIIVALVLAAAFWIDRRRGGTGDARRLDLPGTKSGRPKRVDSGGGGGMWGM